MKEKLSRRKELWKTKWKGQITNLDSKFDKLAQVLKMILGPFLRFVRAVWEKIGLMCHPISRLMPPDCLKLFKTFLEVSGFYESIKLSSL